MLDFLHRIGRYDLERRGGRISRDWVRGSSVWYVDLPPTGRPVGGLAPTFVLVHGLAANALSFYPLIPRLRQHARVLALDLPAYGQSVPPRGAPFVGIQEMVRCVETFIARHAPAGAYLAGNSMGGWISAKVAARRQDLVHGLGLINPAGPFIPREEWVELSRVCTSDEPDVMDHFFRALFARPPLFRRFVSADLRRAFRASAVHGLLENLAEEDFVNPRELERIACPSVLIWGEQDGFIPRACRDFYARHLPRRRIAPILDCGHCPQLERPRATAEFLLSLVEQPGGSRRHASFGDQCSSAN